MPTPSSTWHRFPAVATRSERVAQRSGMHGFFNRTAAFLKNGHRGKFIVLMFLTSIVFGCVVAAWNPPFRFRINQIIDRDIICNTPFAVFSPEQTQLEAYHARISAPHVFINDPQPLIQLREALWNTVVVLARASTYSELEEQDRPLWLDFLRPTGHEEILEHQDAEAAFADFVAYFRNETNFDEFQLKLYRMFSPFEESGILMRLPFGPEHGSQDRILVYRRDGNMDQLQEYSVSQVLLRDGALMRYAMHREMRNQHLGDQLFNWIYPKIPETLREDQHATAIIAKEAADAVEDVVVEYTQGQLLVKAGTTLQRGDIDLLLAEYKAFLRTRTQTERLGRFISVSSVFFLTLLIVVSLCFRTERRRPQTPQAFFYLMLGMIATIVAAQYTPWLTLIGTEPEILAIMLFVMFIAVIYSWQLATILAVFLTIVIISGNGSGIASFIVLFGTSVATAIQLGRLRSRGKLVTVSIISGLVAFVLTVALGIQDDRFFVGQLYVDAAINFLWAVLAGLLMTGILPFIERQFGIFTDMSLLELGDMSHPLIQKLIKAAPATHGHCIQVGIIAENAADAILAKGLLVRVGAHFHDIGKIMKPEYFSENQFGMGNVHDNLEPQISTIVLIAHVKDGVDLAKQYHIPKPLIDLIEQHHGTSLASFFYGRAIKEGQENVAESTYRYPGPKPKTKEAAILMIADASESACRSLGTGIPPNKIEAKIRTIIKQKLDDGQFDDSGLTLNELKIIEKSVVNSIVAAMHSRIQYPDGTQTERDPLDAMQDSGIWRMVQN